MLDVMAACAGHTRYALLLVMVIACAGCDERADRAASDAGRDAGPLDAGRADAGRDAGPHDAGLDAGDAGDGGDAQVPDAAAPSCDVARCPAATAAPLPLIYFGEVESLEQRSCCVLDFGEQPTGECGVFWLTEYGFEPICAPIVEGVLDDTCLDVRVGGELVQGCRKANGRCGHLTPGWGCHGMYRFFWSADADADPRSPNPFACAPFEEPCTHTSECCEHPNYGGVCFGDAHGADAGTGDAGTPIGVCGNIEEGPGGIELP